MSAVSFTIAFPIVTYLVPGGVLFGAFMVIPLTLFAWNWGERTGVVAAVIGIFYTEVAYSIGHFLVLHNPITSFWAMVTFVPPLVFLFVGIVVGRLSNTLRELRATMAAKILAETALGLAEKKYQDLFEHAPQAIVVIQESRIVLCNRNVVDRTGYSEKELTGAVFTDFALPEDCRMLLAFHKRVVAGNGDAESVMGRFIDKSHRVRWLEITGRKITWEEKPAGLYFSNDVTERVRAEQELKNSHAHLHAVLNAIPDLLFEVDRKGRFYEVPTPHTDHLIASPHVFIGRTIVEILPADAAAICMDALERASWSGEDRGATYTLDTEGGTRWFELSISAIGDSQAENAHFIVLVREITERKKSEVALADSNAHFNAVLNALPDLMLEFDRDGRVYDMRASHPDRLLYALPFSPIGRTVRELLPEDASRTIMESIARASETGEYRSPAFSLTHNCTTKWFELSLAAIGAHDNPDCHYIGLERDITERKNLEEQFIQSQKMEAVGRLAGGIAHDFNNILMVILGYCDLIREVPDDRKETLKDIGIIRDSAEKAASLTHQLLAFSRKQIVQSAVVDLNALLKRSEELLRRVLGEDVGLIVRVSERPCKVKADAGQLQQVVMNLATNARDAMPGGGRLTIEAQAVEVREGDECSEIAPGAYARMSFSDTGAGMDTQTAARIFEPFFTTKELGKGTGLGLSIVYGIVKQSEGYITVASKLGVGTTFRIYLPLTLDSGETRGLCEERLHRGTETILLVEDEDSVRDLILRNLSSSGYAVLEARNGAEAVKICQLHTGPIHLLLTDVVMPGMGGGKVAERVRACHPDARILLMTGYTSKIEGLEQSFVEVPRILHKPFDMQELQISVRKALEDNTPGSAPPGD